MLNNDYVRGIPSFLNKRAGVKLNDVFLMKNSANPLNHTACFKITVDKKLEDDNPTKDLESKNKKDLLKQHEEKTTEQKKIVSDTQGASSSLEKPKELTSVKDNEKGEVKSGEAPEVPVNPKEASSVNGDEKAEVKAEDTSSTSLKNKEIESETK